jgi:hypothetical protein
MGDDGVCDIAQSLKDLKPLRTLDLGSNHITAEGILTLIENIACCPTLTHLNLSGTPALG